MTPQDKTPIRALIEVVEGGTATMHDFASPFPSESAYGKTTWGTAHNAYSGSLDAAKGLHEALLPGWPYTIENVTGQTYRAWTDKARNLRQPGFSDRGPCPARAWLLAILRAYEAQQ